MMIIGGRDGAVQLADHYAIAPDAEVYDDDAMQDHDDGLSIHKSNVHVSNTSEDDVASVVAQIPDTGTDTDADADGVPSGEASWQGCGLITEFEATCAEKRR